MENNNSNKPLSAYELLNLIKLKSSEQPIDKDLDDFEKDALEGYVNHSSMDSFAKLNIDVQLEISKKATEKTFFKNRNTIIFSAAASIVLIILISLFYLIEFNKHSSSELALNNQILQEAPINRVKDDLEKLNQDEILVEDKKSKQVADTAEEVFFKTDAKKLETSSSPLASQTTNDADAKIVSNKEEVKPTEAMGGVTVSQGFSYIEKPQVASADLSLNNIKTDQEDDNTENIKSISESGKREKISVATLSKKISVQATTNSNTIETKASFAGGEVGIKNYVISNVKQSKLDEKLTGSYKINVIIKPNGTIKVLKIRSILNGDSKTINKISIILNSMKNWNPEMDNGKAVQSNKEFVLDF